MKLTDLYEAFDTQVTDKTTSRSFRPSVPAERDDELGRGSFAVTRDTKGDPHTVKKQQFDDADVVEETDAFQDYARIIYKNKLWDKIHFPRIYAAKKLTDRNGKTLYRWEMEKLKSIKDLVVSDQEGSDFDAEALYNFFSRYVEEEYAMHYTKALDVFRESILTGKTDKIVDEELARSLKWLHQIYQHLSKKYKQLRLDLSIGNIMVRRTNVGPQLVFTDPFYAVK